MARLVLNPDRADERVFELPPGGATIGRSSENHVCVVHHSLSRAHARIEVQDGRFYVTDLGSKNGTTVRGEHAARTEVKDGDTFQCGDLLFRLIGAGAATVAPRRARPAPSAAERLDALTRAIALLPALADGEGSLEALVGIAYEVLDVDRIVLVVFDPVSGAAAQRAARASDASATEIAPRSDVFERVRRGAAPVHGEAGARAWTCVPVRRRGAAVGALYVDGGARLDDAALELLGSIAAIAAVAIGR
jgi:adenylate cyclase